MDLFEITGLSWVSLACGWQETEPVMRIKEDVSCSAKIKKAPPAGRAFSLKKL